MVYLILSGIKVETKEEKEVFWQNKYFLKEYQYHIEKKII